MTHMMRIAFATTSVVLLLSVTVIDASAAPDPSEPVSYAGHGVLFAYDGSEAVPTATFVGFSTPTSIT